MNPLLGYHMTKTEQGATSDYSDTVGKPGMAPRSGGAFRFQRNALRYLVVIGSLLVVSSVVSFLVG